MSGTAEIVRDPAKMYALWNQFAREWFDSTPDDPSLVLIKVTGQVGVLWEGQSYFERLIELVRTRLGGQAATQRAEEIVTRADLSE